MNELAFFMTANILHFWGTLNFLERVQTNMTIQKAIFENQQTL